MAKRLLTTWPEECCAGLNGSGNGKHDTLDGGRRRTPRDERASAERDERTAGTGRCAELRHCRDGRHWRADVRRTGENTAHKGRVSRRASGQEERAIDF